MSELLLARRLESQAPQGGNRGEESVPRRFDPFPGLGIKERGRIEEPRAWEGESSGRVSERAGEVECTGEEERDNDLNAVRLKIVEIGSTGQTGCPDWSDRSGPG